MINPQELRIGNYVEYMGEYKPVLAVDGERNDIEMGLNGTVTLPEYLSNSTHAWTTTGRWCNKINPIPITPYCLDTLGFKEETHLYPIKNVHKEIIRLYKMGAIWIYFTNDNLHSVCTSSGSTEHSHIKYVHQLQNLYHAHKNKDLTFKTTTHEQK